MDRRRLIRNIASGHRARERMLLTGMTPNGHPLWEPPETADLSGNYPDYDAALKKLSRRTRPAAHSKAGRMGITRPAGKRWNEENDKPKMRRFYPTATPAELMVAFPGRTWGAICARARSWGLRRARRRAKPKGNALIDSIIERGAQLNFTESELGTVGNSPKFFYRRHERLSSKDWAVIQRVVSALGGTLRARFPG